VPELKDALSSLNRLLLGTDISHVAWREQSDLTMMVGSAFLSNTSVRRHAVIRDSRTAVGGRVNGQKWIGGVVSVHEAG
jgi:hypothetical protein